MVRRIAHLVVAVVVMAIAALPSSALASAPDGRLMRPFGTTAPTAAASTGLMSYHGGLGGVGIETSPQVYIVFWGWSSDPSGEGPYLAHFLQGVGGSQWASSQTQYCENVAAGTTNCALQSGAVYAGNPTGVLKGYWIDTTNFEPLHPSGSDFAAEAVRAAAHFGNVTPSANVTAQYVIATPHGRNSLGFGLIFCAYHNYTATSYGNIAFTNLPYIPDAGAACGRNFVNAGTAGLLDGVSIVEGHEFAETVTDQFPSGGWLDANGQETGDKCAWISSGQGASQNIALSTGTYAVQSLWSNAFNGGAGGCVI